MTNTKTEAIKPSSEEKQKKEIKRFVIVMVVFTIGMAFLLFYDVSAWWIWYIYFAVWTFIEYKIAKNINLEWWHWIIIIVVIILIDWVVLELIEFVK